jgi:opacity protein-like surface antigen
MHMKKLLLASSALALLSGVPSAQAGGLYLSVFGGANWQSDSDAAYTGLYSSARQSIEPDTGFVLGGAIGAKLTNWVNGLRGELEVSYRRNDLGGLWTSSGGEGSGPIDGNISTFAIMANALYDFNLGWNIRPHVGAGIGWGRTQADGAFVSYTSTFDMEATGFAWQLIAGFNYQCAPGVDVGIDYRYFRGPDFPCFAFGGECGFSVVEDFGGEAGLENENHAVTVNLSIDIN